MAAPSFILAPLIKGYEESASLEVHLVSGKVPMAIDMLDALYPEHLAGTARILALSGTRRTGFTP